MHSTQAVARRIQTPFPSSTQLQFTHTPFFSPPLLPAAQRVSQNLANLDDLLLVPQPREMCLLIQQHNRNPLPRNKEIEVIVLASHIILVQLSLMFIAVSVVHERGFEEDNGSISSWDEPSWLSSRGGSRGIDLVDGVENAFLVRKS